MHDRQIRKKGKRKTEIRTNSVSENFFKNATTGLVTFLFVLFSLPQVYAQSNNPNEAKWNGQGYSLKKVVSNPAVPNSCCAQFVSECETDSVVVSISNGTFASATLNGASLSSGFAGQSSFTFDTNSTSPNLITCVTPDSTGVVVINYTAYFSNGEKCEEKVEMDCVAPEPTSDCCPVVDFKLRCSWPFFNKYVGTFEIINPDPSNPICSVQISSSSAGSFNTGNLIIDGTASGQSWNSTSIPASGTLSPQAVNDMCRGTMLSSN